MDEENGLKATPEEMLSDEMRNLEQDPKIFTLADFELDKEVEIPLTQGRLVYKDRMESIGETQCVVREIISTEGLEDLIETSAFLYTTGEGIKLLRQLTNDRAPSFLTFSHVFAADDNNPSMSLENIEQIGINGLIHHGINGMSTSTPFSRFPDFYSRFHHQQHDNYLPMFVFGPKNSRFNEFVANKYSKIQANIPSQVTEGMVVEKDFSSVSAKFGDLEILAIYDRFNRSGKKTGQTSKLQKISQAINFEYLRGDEGANQIGLQAAELIRQEDVSKNPNVSFGKLYGDGWGWDNYAQRKKIEMDYYVWKGLPAYAETLDGSYVTTEVGEATEISDWGNIDKPLQFRDAEMMIDLYGLWDGKKKVVFFL